MNKRHALLHRDHPSSYRVLVAGSEQACNEVRDMLLKSRLRGAQLLVAPDSKETYWPGARHALGSGAGAPKRRRDAKQSIRGTAGHRV